MDAAPSVNAKATGRTRFSIHASFGVEGIDRWVRRPRDYSYPSGAGADLRRHPPTDPDRMDSDQRDLVEMFKAPPLPLKIVPVLWKDAGASTIADRQDRTPSLPTGTRHRLR